MLYTVLRHGHGLTVAFSPLPAPTLLLCVCVCVRARVCVCVLYVCGVCLHMYSLPAKRRYTRPCIE